MAKLVTIESGFYRIPLPTVLSDSTHGANTRVRTQYGSAARCGRRRGRRLYVHRWTQRRCDRRRLDARNAGDVRRRRGRRNRAALAQGLVGAALRRSRRPDGARHLRLRHGALGPEGAAGATAVMEFSRRLRSESALLRRRHRSRPAAGQAAAADRRQSRQGVSRDQDEGRPRAARRRTSTASRRCATTSATASR